MVIETYQLTGYADKRALNYFKNRFGFKENYSDKEGLISLEGELSNSQVIRIEKDIANTYLTLNPSIKIKAEEGHLEFVERRIREQDEINDKRNSEIDKITDSNFDPNEIIHGTDEELLRSDKKEQIREGMILVEVPQHDRKLKSGKTITIKAHSKWIPKK